MGGSGVVVEVVAVCVFTVLAAFLPPYKSFMGTHVSTTAVFLLLSSGFVWDPHHTHVNGCMAVLQDDMPLLTWLNDSHEVSSSCGAW